MSDEEPGTEGGEAGKRRRCQSCHRAEAEHHCQACRRFVCDACVTPPGDADVDDGGCELESFLQSAMTRCRACRDEEVRLPPHEVEFEPRGGS